MHKLAGRSGFTLVEILFVLAVLSLLTVIAIPAFVSAQRNAQRNTCISNLKHIDEAKTLYALDSNLSAGAPVEMSDLVTDYIRSTPRCPAGGTYTVGATGTVPTCTIEGHELYSSSTSGLSAPAPAPTPLPRPAPVPIPRRWFNPRRWFVPHRGFR